MVHAQLSSVNPSLSAEVETCLMRETWALIERAIAAKPDGKGREVAWLSDKLGCTIQRVNNWKARGVPTSALQDIADALGWSVDALHGRADPPSDPWPFETVPRERFDALSERQKGALEMVMLETISELEAAASSASRKHHAKAA